MDLTADALGALALARQLPTSPPPDSADQVADLVRRIGPMQTQTARSTYLGLAARCPGITHAAVTRAFEEGTILRGSNLRGTVHTVAADQHPLLEAATRIARTKDLIRVLRPTAFEVAELWEELEAYAAAEPRTADELHTHLAAWVAEREGRDAATVRDGVGRSLSYTHGGLVRRPLSGGWEGQGRAGYTTARVPGRRSRIAAPSALPDLVRAHLAAHGPASREDLSWWAGLGLTPLDAAIEALDADVGLVRHTGPDGRTYVDLPGAPHPVTETGVRLLPEFDGLMCAYEPSARRRFVSEGHHARLWNQRNATVLPPLLVDGRISGYWRAMGSARRRPLEVVWFARTRRPRRAELEQPVAALEAVLGITVLGVEIVREAV